MPEEADPPYRARLEDAKRASVAQLLFKAARLLNEEAIARVRAATGERRIRTAHTALFPHVSLDGTRLTELAARLGVTKQAAGELVAELEAMGVLERVPDPSDGRAKLIRFSARGRQGLLQGLGVLRAIEHELAGRLGPRRMLGLHGTLLDLVAELEARAGAGPPERTAPRRT
jgi:DNA-binding MarR family transcriptional regulator